jgi:putative sterol carrier protein
MTGKLKIKGDMGAAMKLKTLLVLDSTSTAPPAT